MDAKIAGTFSNCNTATVFLNCTGFTPVILDFTFLQAYMAKRKSSGILLYRDGAAENEVFLVLPGGPFWANKDAGAWSITKGEFDDSETPLAAAIREFQEETGTLLHGDFWELKPVVQKAGKQVFAFAL